MLYFFFNLDILLVLESINLLKRVFNSLWRRHDLGHFNQLTLKWCFVIELLVWVGFCEKWNHFATCSSILDNFSCARFIRKLLVTEGAQSVGASCNFPVCFFLKRFFIWTVYITCSQIVLINEQFRKLTCLSR